MWQCWRKWGFSKGLQTRRDGHWLQVHHSKYITTKWLSQEEICYSVQQSMCNTQWWEVFSCFKKWLMDSSNQLTSIRDLNLFQHFWERKEKHQLQCKNLVKYASWHIASCKISWLRHIGNLCNGHPVSSYHVLNTKMWKTCLAKNEIFLCKSYDEGYKVKKQLYFLSVIRGPMIKKLKQFWNIIKLIIMFIR